jgi:hypothetical protein
VIVPGLNLLVYASDQRAVRHADGDFARFSGVRYRNPLTS